MADGCGEAPKNDGDRVHPGPKFSLSHNKTITLFFLLYRNRRLTAVNPSERETMNRGYVQAVAQEAFDPDPPVFLRFAGSASYLQCVLVCVDGGVTALQTGLVFW